MKSRWGLVLPGQLMLVEEEKAGKGGKETPQCWRRGHRFGLWFVVGLCFLIFLSFLKKKPPSCVIIFMGSAILAKICL